MREKLNGLRSRYPKRIGDVRGVGLMNAMELVTENGEPDASLTGQIKQKALEKDLLLLSKIKHSPSRVLRLASRSAALPITPPP